MEWITGLAVSHPYYRPSLATAAYNFTAEASEGFKKVMTEE